MSMPDPVVLLCSVVALTLAFIIHEYAHALSAYTLGDPTPKYEGRLTLNPLTHIDPIGSVVMLMTMLFSHVVLGWAKPVRIDRGNLKGGHLDAALVAFAGPFANFVLAFLAGMLLLLGLGRIGPLGVFLYCLIKANLGFGLFNCIPWPPLDGWKIVGGFLPRDLGDKMFRFELKVGLYGVIVLLLLSPLVVNPILGPIYTTLLGLLTRGYTP